MEPNELERENLAQTLARELKVPKVLMDGAAQAEIALPPGWKLEKIDREQLEANPRRIKTNATATSKDAFADYVCRHQTGNGASTVWCDLDAANGKVKFLALLDDHAAAGAIPGWRSHKTTFDPAFSVEWARWVANNKKPYGQAEFACFLEDNQKDIMGGDTFPDGGQMLAMALDFEAKQDSRFKSAIRTQSGSVRMEFVAADDAGTVQAMSVFERFRIAIPVFRDDAARFPIVARLRYRTRDSKLSFWYELIREDLVFEQSSRELVDYVRTKCDLPFFFGNPG